MCPHPQFSWTKLEMFIQFFLLTSTLSNLLEAVYFKDEDFFRFFYIQFVFPCCHHLRADFTNHPLGPKEDYVGSQICVKSISLDTMDVIAILTGFTQSWEIAGLFQQQEIKPTYIDLQLSDVYIFFFIWWNSDSIKPINETGVACPLLTPPVYTIHPLCIIFPPPISHTITYGNLVLLVWNIRWNTSRQSFHICDSLI